MDRTSELLTALEHDGSWMTAARLASELDCSARTVKTIVRHLNQEHSGIVESGSTDWRPSGGRAHPRRRCSLEQGFDNSPNGGRAPHAHPLSASHAPTRG